jgi:uncharacterized protein YecE (DUF72 family)
MGHIRIGTSGYDYPHWRSRFYPADLPRNRWLAYLAERLDTVELNGTFYSLKSPDVFRRWVAGTPPGFLFAVKGSRFITHNLKLRRAEGALANFFASGVLALGRKTGPFLWQLPDSYRFEPERLETFLRLLPRSSEAAADLARGHDHRLKRGALVEPAAKVRYRHAFEVRHESYFTGEFYELLRRHRCGFVVADTAGTFSYAEEVTARFVYVRLHGSRKLYGSAYTPAELAAWAGRLEAWAGPARGGRDVYVYFDNDARAYAPRDAMALAGIVGSPDAGPTARPPASAGSAGAGTR